MAATSKKPYLFLLLAASLLLALAAISCHKAAPPLPKPTEAALPLFTDSLIYTSAGTMYLTDLTGDQVEKLTGSSGSDWFPAASPDQNQIAFWSNAPGTYELMVMDLNSQRRRRVTWFNETSLPAGLQNFSMHNAPAWSPDGKRIAFGFYGKIWVVETTGFNPETVVADSENYSPAWSPDGNLLAFVTNRGKTHNLYIHKMSTSEEWALTSFPSSQTAGGPVWSPDGKVLAFTISAREDSDIWSIRADGSHLTRLTQDKRSHSPAWSLDSKRLAFASGRQDPFHWEIWVMNANGSGAFCVTRNGGFSPAWLRIPNRPFAPATAPAPPAETKAAIEPPNAAGEPEREKPIPPKILRSQPEVLKVLVPTPLPTVTQAPTPKSRPTFTTEPTPRPRRMQPLAPARPLPAASAVPIKPLPKPVEKKIAAVPISLPTAKPTSKPTLEPTPEPTPEPTRSPDLKKENNYSEYEKYAEADKSILPDLDIAEDKAAHRLLYKPKIDFYFGKDLIKPSSFPMLSRLAEELGKHNDCPLVVQGQPSGPAWLRPFLGNSLSRARANSVLRHLIVTEKIRQINVNALGQGDEFPDLGKRPVDQPVLLIIVK